MLEGYEKEYIKESNIANLIDNARFLRDVFDGIRDQIMVVDSDYRIEDVNAELIERLDIKKHEIIGKRCYEVLHDLDGPCDLPNHPCPVQDALKTGTPHEVLIRIPWGVIVHTTGLWHIQCWMIRARLPE